MRSLCLALALVLTAAAAGAEVDSARARWNLPVEPFRIFGPLYYVGTADLASFAFATRDGVILLDGGLPESAPLVEKSLATLGFRMEDVKILLNSHAHFDHAGGLAELQRKSGAQMVAHARDVEELASGGRGDFAWGDAYAFPPVKVDRRIGDGETVRLGEVTLTAHLTAGHTKGCTTWTATLADGDERREALFLCSTSVPDPESYRLADNPRYPEIAADYERTFALLEKLPCDLFFGAHASFFGMEEKRQRLLAGQRDAFVDPAGYRAFVAQNAARFRELLAAARTALRAPAP